MLMWAVLLGPRSKKEMPKMSFNVDGDGIYMLRDGKISKELVRIESRRLRAT